MKPLLIIGKTGRLGHAFSRICSRMGLEYVLLGRSELDITDPLSVTQTLESLEPWALINAAGYTRIEEAEQNPDACLVVNSRGAACLARCAAQYGVKFLTYSSDQIFDGNKSEPYREEDAPNPVNTYGRSKLIAEMQVTEHNPSAIIIRSSTFFGPWDTHNFLHATLESWEQGKSVRHAADSRTTLTYLPDLVWASLELLLHDERGIWHAANAGAYSWFELAKELAHRSGTGHGLLDAAVSADFQTRASYPRHTVLESSRGLILPPLENAFSRFFSERKPERMAMAC
jgi:dTDP-4-dehydrorhamnose reductase